MRDTTPEFERRYAEMLADLTCEERLRMVAELFVTARSFARAGIMADEPGLSEVEIEKRVFLRFYGHELPAGLIERALRGIDAKYASTPAPG